MRPHPWNRGLRRWGTPALVLGLIPVMTGCGTIADGIPRGDLDDSDKDRVFDSSGPYVYGGVRMDLLWGDPDYWGGHLAPVAFFFWIDGVLSSALDTAVLPLTLPYGLV